MVEIVVTGTFRFLGTTPWVRRTICCGKPMFSVMARCTVQYVPWLHTPGSVVPCSRRGFNGLAFFFFFRMYKSGLTQLIRWRLRTDIPRRAGVVGQLVFFWAFPNMTWMDQRPTLGFGIGGMGSPGSWSGLELG
jgi:hypothetical protein